MANYQNSKSNISWFFKCEKKCCFVEEIIVGLQLGHFGDSYQCLKFELLHRSRIDWAEWW